MARKTTKGKRNSSGSDDVVEEPTPVVDGAEELAEPVEEVSVATDDPAPEDVPVDTEEMAVSEDISEVQATAESQKSRSGGLIVGLLLGGALTALGIYLFQSQYSQQETALAQLENRLAALETENSALKSEVDALRDADFRGGLDTLGATLSETETRMEGIDGRLTAIETGVVQFTEADGEALTATQAQLAALQNLIAEQEAQIEEHAARAAAQLEQTRTEAQALEAGSVEAARAATARAAIAEIRAQIEAGAPYPDQLAELEGAIGPAPAGLSATAAEGAPTLATLLEVFPPAAKEAISAARDAGVSGEDTSRFGAFLRDQFDIRSTQAREGSDVDAVLSRAEAALRENRVSDAVSEAETLPDVAKSAMAEWLTLATSRRDALMALETLTASQN